MEKNNALLLHDNMIQTKSRSTDLTCFLGGGKKKPSDDAGARSRMCLCTAGNDPVSSKRRSEVNSV